MLVVRVVALAVTLLSRSCLGIGYDANGPPSHTAVDVFIMQALTIIPLAYGLGLCMGRCHPIYVAVLYILAAISGYFYFNPDFSIYKNPALLVSPHVTYQHYARCYFLAAFGAMVCAVHVQQPVLRFGLFVMGLLFSTAMLQTGGRGGILELGASIAAVTVYQFPRWRWPIVLILLSIGLITKFTSDAALFQLYDFAHTNRLFSIERLVIKFLPGAQASEVGRDVLAMRAVAVWTDHPVLGIGLGGFPMIAGFGDDPGMYPHNMFLEVLAEQGLIGFIMFGGLFWWIVLRYLRIRHVLPTTYKFYIVGMTAAVLARGMTSGHIESDTELWILAGFIVSLSWEYEQAAWVRLRMLPARHQRESTAAIGSGAKPRPEKY